MRNHLAEALCTENSTGLLRSGRGMISANKIFEIRQPLMMDVKHVTARKKLTTAPSTRGSGHLPFVKALKKKRFCQRWTKIGTSSAAPTNS